MRYELLYLALAEPNSNTLPIVKLVKFFVSPRATMDPSWTWPCAKTSSDLLDCEGAEYDILKSIQAEHAAKLPKLVFETDGPEARKKALFDHLESLGYQIRTSSSLYIAEL